MNIVTEDFCVANNNATQLSVAGGNVEVIT